MIEGNHMQRFMDTLDNELLNNNDEQDVSPPLMDDENLTEIDDEESC